MTSMEPTCVHEARQIEWLDKDGVWQMAYQTIYGTWLHSWRTASGADMMKLHRCPGCRVKLWGRPDQKVTRLDAPLVGGYW